MIRNSVRMQRRLIENRNVPAWSLVSNITGHGSGYSYEIAKLCGVDPDSVKPKTDLV